MRTGNWNLDDRRPAIADPGLIGRRTLLSLARAGSGIDYDPTLVETGRIRRDECGVADEAANSTEPDQEPCLDTHELSAVAAAQGNDEIRSLCGLADRKAMESFHIEETSESSAKLHFERHLVEPPGARVTVSPLLQTDFGFA